MRTTRRPLALILLVVCALMLGFLMPLLSDPKVIQLCVVISMSAMLVPTIITGSWRSVGTIYLGFYWVFHFGIMVPMGLGWTPRLFNATDNSWATIPNLADAAVPAAAFMVACAAAYLLSVRPLKVVGPPVAPPVPGSDVLDGVVVVGAFLLLGGLALWTGIFLGSGAPLVGGYVQFLILTQGSLTPYAYLFISMGMALIGAARHRQLSRVAILAFILWSFPAFLLGLRGEVLIPILAFVVARSRSGRLRVRGRWLILAGLLAASVGSLVRVLRVGGPVGVGAANPLNGLVELGYSIRPMIMVQTVHDGAGEAFRGFATYLAPVERLFIGRVLGQQVQPTTSDYDVFSSFVVANYGPIGGSVSAEAYRAGGVLYVLLLACILGLVLGRLETVASTGLTDGFVGMVASILLLWVRNDFTPVPLSLLLVGAISLIIYTTAGRRGSDHATEHGAFSNPRQALPRVRPAWLRMSHSHVDERTFP